MKNRQTLCNTIAKLMRIKTEEELSDIEEAKELARKILNSGNARLVVRDSVSVEGASDRLPSNLCRADRMAMIILYNPLHPMLLSDVGAITHLVCKCSIQAEVRWISLASDIITEKRFIMAIVADYTK